jgi:hypothetical protein
MIKALWALAAGATFLGGCASGNVPSLPGQSADAAARAVQIVISPSAKISLLQTGQTQRVTVSEKNYSGGFSAAPAKACKNVATIKGQNRRFTVKAGTKAGTCAIVFSDGNGRQAQAEAVVTLTRGVID